MNGSTQTTQEQTQNRQPWAPAMPALQGILANAQNAYSSGMPQVYQGQRVAGTTADTQAGYDAIRQGAGATQQATGNGIDYVTQLLNRGGSTADTRQALQGLLNVGTVSTAGIQQAANRMANPNGVAYRAQDALMGGRFAQDASGFNELNQGLAGPTQVQRSLQDTANGRFLGEANPYTSQMIANGQADAANAVKNSFAASGRYGSGMFSGAVGDAVSRVGTDLRYKDYDAERARQAQAAQAIDQGLLARTGARQSLYGAANDVQGANAGQFLQGAQIGMQGNQQALQGAQALAAQQMANNQQRIGQHTTALGAAQGDRAATMAGIGALPGLQGAAMAPGQALLGIGSAQQAQQQAQLAARQDQFNEATNAPWRQLGLLSGTVTPIAGLGGQSQSTTVTTPPEPGLLQQLLGGGLAATSLLGQTGAFGPVGMVAGQAAGAAAPSGGWLTNMFR